MKYAVIYEKSKTGYGAYVPDLPGCAVIGRTLNSTKRRIETAIKMHIAALRADGDPIPKPTTDTDYVEVPEVTYAAQK